MVRALNVRARRLLPDVSLLNQIQATAAEGDGLSRSLRRPARSLRGLVFATLRWRINVGAQFVAGNTACPLNFQNPFGGNARPLGNGLGRNPDLCRQFLH